MFMPFHLALPIIHGFLMHSAYSQFVGNKLSWFIFKVVHQYSCIFSTLHFHCTLAHGFCRNTQTICVKAIFLVCSESALSSRSVQYIVEPETHMQRPYFCWRQSVMPRGLLCRLRKTISGRCLSSSGNYRLFFSTKSRIDSIFDSAAARKATLVKHCECRGTV